MRLLIFLGYAKKRNTDEKRLTTPAKILNTKWARHLLNTSRYMYCTDTAFHGIGRTAKEDTMRKQNTGKD